MPYYYLRIIPSRTPAYYATPYASIVAAMTTACGALRYGATDAWVEDETGEKVADLQAIKKHCGVV